MNSKYNQNLLNGIFFSGMLRDYETNVYYNVSTQDVLDETNGCLSSLIALDQSAENRKLLLKIQMGKYDEIIDGVHILIPRLTQYKFIQELKQNIENNLKLLEFLKDYEEETISEFMNEYDEEVSLSELFFTNYIIQEFFNKLFKYCDENQIEKSTVDGYLTDTVNSIAIDFLENY